MLDVLRTNRAKSAQLNRITMAGYTSVVRAVRPAVVADPNLAEMELYGSYGGGTFPISVVYIVCSQVQNEPKSMPFSFFRAGREVFRLEKCGKRRQNTRKGMHALCSLEKRALIKPPSLIQVII